MALMGLHYLSAWSYVWLVGKYIDRTLVCLCAGKIKYRRFMCEVPITYISTLVRTWPGVMVGRKIHRPGHSYMPRRHSN